MLNMQTRRGAVRILPADESDIDAFRELRLEALRAHPESFASDFEESRQRPREHWLQRIRTTERQITYVAQDATTGALAGMTGIFRDDGVKVRHSADIWGVYVRADWRGLRLSEALINACLAWARTSGLRIVRLSVVTTNAQAIRCYQRCGFEQYGCAPEVIHANGRYYDEILMSRRMNGDSA